MACQTSIWSDPSRRYTTSSSSSLIRFRRISHRGEHDFHEGSSAENRTVLLHVRHRPQWSDRRERNALRCWGRFSPWECQISSTRWVIVSSFLCWSARNRFCPFSHLIALTFWYTSLCVFFTRVSMFLFWSIACRSFLVHLRIDGYRHSRFNTNRYESSRDLRQSGMWSIGILEKRSICFGLQEWPLYSQTLSTKYESAG